MSKEYIGAVTLILGSILKVFNIEIENEALEGFIWGIIAIIIAVSRYKKGDINVLGAKN